MATMLDAVINLKDNFSKTLENIDKNAKNFQKTAQRTGRDVWGAGKTMEKTGKTLTKGLTVPIVGIGVAAGKMSKDFNESLASIGTMIPGQTERLQELKGEIQDVAITTAKSTKEIAEGTYGVISAYGDAEDTMQKVELNAKAATAGLATTSDALDLSSAIMKGYGDTTAESNEKVLDLAFTTLKLGQTTFPDLAASMGKVVPTSNELGISQEELFAIFATGTGVTGNASEVSTQYQGVLKSLMSPTKDMSKLIDDMGYKDGKAMIAKEGLGGAINTIVDSAKKSGKPLSSYVGSIQGQVLALALAGEQSDVYDEKLQELMESTGALDTAFFEQTEGINKAGFSFEQSMIKMQVAGQKLGDALAPTIERLADGFSKVADKLSNLTPEQLDTIIKFAKMAAIIGPIILVVGKLTTGVAKGIFVFSDMAKKINALGGVMKLLTSPGMIVVGVFLALIAAGILIYKNWDTIKERANEIFPNLQESISTVMDNISNIFSGTVELLIMAWGLVEPAFTAVWETIKGLFETGIVFIGEMIENITTVFSGVIDFLTGAFTGNWEKAWSGVVQIFEGIFGMVESIGKGVINGVIDIINGAIGGLNKIKIPDWVPGIGGKGVNIPVIPKLAKGTKNWAGGIAQVHERGGEIIDLPSKSRVYPHDKSVSMAREQGRQEGSSGGVLITGNTFNVREETDIDKIATKLARKLQKARFNMAQGVG